MNDNELQQIETNIKQARNLADLGNCLERLRNNRDFKKVIMEGYFEQEAIRLVHLKSDPNMQTNDKQSSIVSQMNAIGTLRQYFSTVSTLASMAAKSIESDEQTRDDLLSEAL